MRKKAASLAFGIAFVSLFALALAQSASAATTTLSPAVPFTKTVHANTFDFINYSWAATPTTASVLFVITQPDGSTWEYNGSSYEFFVLASTSGTYTFSWTDMDSTPVTLTYDVATASSGLQPAEHLIDTALILIVVGVIAAIVIIVLVIFVAVRSDKKPAQQPVHGPPQQYAPPGEAPAPYMPGMCPKCGNPIDSQHVFCPKCGARVR